MSKIRRKPTQAAKNVRSGISATAHRGASYRDQAMAGWDPIAASADADLLPDLSRLTARSRDLVRNNGLMSGARQTYADNIVGNILRLTCQPDYRLLGWDREQAREWGNHVEAHFRSWAETTECDASNTLNLLGLTVQALSNSMINGDAVALPVFERRPGSRWQTRIMSIEADRLSTPPWLVSDPKVRGGIRFNHFGAPVSYLIQRSHPGDVAAGLFASQGDGVNPWGWETVPAFTPWGRRRVLHLHDKERTGQSRGKPIVSAVMAEFKMAGDYASNELQASVANSLIAAFVESNLSPDAITRLFAGDADELSPRDVWNQSLSELQQGSTNLRGGAMIPMPIGTKVSGFTPSRPNAAFEAFMLATLRQISAGLNIPYELLAKDFSRTNYSSARAALLEAWRYFHGRRRWLTDMWLRPIFALWLEEAVDKGVVQAPDFYEQQYAYTRCRFIFGGRGWVDPVKEANASALRMNTGVSTMEQECAEQGLDYEEVMDQRQIEKEMLRSRGLSNGSSGISTGKEDSADDEEEEVKK